MPVTGGSPRRLTTGHYVWGRFFHGKANAWHGQHRRKTIYHYTFGKVFSGDAGSWGDYSWSADSQRITFCSWRGGQQTGIWMVRVNGGIPQKLTDPEGRNYCPVWCPDDTTIAFLSDRGLGDHHLWLVDSIGRTLRQTDLPVGCPFAWSPDGTRLAYNTQETLVVLDLSQIPPVATTIFWGFITPARPCWHPDGRTILFQRRPTTQRIHIMEVEGTSFEGKCP